MFQVKGKEGFPFAVSPAIPQAFPVKSAADGILIFVLQMS